MSREAIYGYEFFVIFGVKYSSYGRIYLMRQVLVQGISSHLSALSRPQPNENAKSGNIIFLKWLDHC